MDEEQFIFDLFVRGFPSLWFRVPVGNESASDLIGSCAVNVRIESLLWINCMGSHYLLS